MIKYPSLFEINTRVWIKRFYTENTPVTLSQIPDEYWDNLKNKGIDYIWLMGVWKNVPETIEKYCFEEGLIHDYRKALKDWKKEDVIGSPYSINNYIVNPTLGTEEDLLKLKEQLNSKGLFLILDFVPNHFSAASSLLETKPELFLQTDLSRFETDPYSYFKPFEDKDFVFAHGRDPFFPAWQDTVQINYFAPEARTFMKETLLNLTNLCDGVRCDMAMLNLTNVFGNTWGSILNSGNFARPETEFWTETIEAVKTSSPDFLFLGEAYWDLEYQLQKCGFDFTYDKKLTDRIRLNDKTEIVNHLKAKPEYSDRCARFIENHDEKRSYKELGKNLVKSAAVIISTIPGMRFYHDGQFEGKQIKLPVQLGREPVETKQKCIMEYYDKLLKVTNDKVFKEGTWKLLDPVPSWYENKTYINMMAWEWRHGFERRLVVINFSNETSSCRLSLDMEDYPARVKFADLLNNESYFRSAEEIYRDGLFVELPPHQSHIFAY